MWCYGQVAKTIDSQSIIVGSIPTSTTNIGVSYNGSIVGSEPIGGGPIPSTPAIKKYSIMGVMYDRCNYSSIINYMYNL